MKKRILPDLKLASLLFCFYLIPVEVHAQWGVGGGVFWVNSQYPSESTKKYSDLSYLDAPYVGASLHLRYNHWRLEYSRSFMRSGRKSKERFLDQDDIWVVQINVTAKASDTPTDLRLYYDNAVNLYGIGISPFIGLNWQGGKPGSGTGGFSMIEDDTPIFEINTFDTEPKGNPVSYSIGSEFYIPRFTKGRLRVFTVFNYRPGYYVRSLSEGQSYGIAFSEEHKIRGWSTSVGLRLVLW